MSYLTTELIDEFNENGYIIINNVLTTNEIENARNELHNYIQKYRGVSHDDILAGNNNLSLNVRKRGLTSELFYSKFKMNIHLNERIYLTFKELLCKYDKSCTDVIPYIDRVAYRLPDHILAEGGLKLHIDRNPWTTSKAKKVRIVQAFITLTDHYSQESGGLQVVPKFHKTFNEYFQKSYNKQEADLGGEFYRMHGKEHLSAQNRLETIIAPAGSLIIWHNNLPHATCEKLVSHDTREVIYLTYLQNNLKVNMDYWKAQAKNFISNIPPPSYNDENNQIDRDYDIDELTAFQQQLLGL